MQIRLEEKAFDWLECSVAKYRQGLILVRLDLTRNLLTWRDSNRWFNDFIRIVNHEQAEQITIAFSALLEVCHTVPTPTAEQSCRYVWQVRAGLHDSPDALYECAGEGEQLAEWQTFIREIEKASEQLIAPLGGH